MAFDREKTLQAAQKYIEKRKYDRAILEYQKVVHHEPNDARTLLRIGDLQSRLAQYADAIATYDRVALYYAGRGFSLKAIAVLKQIGELIDRHAPQLADQYGHVLPKLAQLYAELGLINDALATYDAVARRLQGRGRERDAVEIIRRMVALDRSNPLPYLRLAEALCRVSRVDEATEHFWSAAQLLSQQGRSDDALKVLERILHFRQDARVARVAAELYLSKGTREAALLSLSRLQLCFEADPRDLETLTLLARAFDAIGQPAKGVEVYKEMVRIARDIGRRELQERYLQHLLRVAPEDDDVRALRAEAGLASAQPASRSSHPPESLSEEDIEFIDDGAVAEADGGAPAARGIDAAARFTPGLAAPDPGPPSEFLRKALVDAESFRGLRLYAKAAAALRHALALAPESIELRAALQAVLLEAGDRLGAVEQMLATAELYADRGSFPAAEAELYHALELSPDHPKALALLAKVEELARQHRASRSRSAPHPALSLRPSEEPSAPHSQSEHEAFELRARISAGRGAPLNAEGTAARAAAPSPELSPERAEEPLPAYELEEDELMPVTPPARPAAPPAAGAAPESPLPQFSLDSGLLQSPAAPAPARPSEAAAEAGASQRPPQSRRESIRAALDEAEFFSARGLYQDATMILRDRLEQYPGETALIEAITRLEPKLHGESGTRDVGRLSESAAEEQAGGLEGRIAEVPGAQGKELRVQFTTDGSAGGGPIIDADSDLEIGRALASVGEEQVDVDEVFAKFKQGVKAQVSDNDSATHYDLGVAYKEMGLLVDAAREFEIASHDSKRECNCLAMMGMMYRESGDLDRAAEAYVRALNAQHKTVAQEVSLYYDLGTVYEMKDDPDEAIYYYQRITRRDPGYRDVSQRLASLLPRSRRYSQPARAINDDQDFDRTFDELYRKD